MNATCRTIVLLAVIIFSIGIFFFCNLFFGAVPIPISAVKNILLGHSGYSTAWTSIILQVRLPQAVIAFFSGAALAASGLMLQILFRNSLSSPDILGISSGANLGVAILLLYYREITYIGWSTLSLGIHLSTVVAAFIGALTALTGILFFSVHVKNHSMVLILGIMIGYLSSSGISILYSFASLESLRSHVLWGLGSFASVTSDCIPLFCFCILTGLLASSFLIKPLNIMSLGENYTTNLGINIKRIRTIILIITGFLTAVVTAFCGPISFIGLITPHIIRTILGTSDQQFLFPATLLLGSSIALFCNWITIIPFLGHHFLPLNAVIPLMGSPIVIYMIISEKKNHQIDILLG